LKERKRFNLETEVGREKVAQSIGVHVEIKKSCGHLGGDETFLYFARYAKSLRGLL